LPPNTAATEENLKDFRAYLCKVNEYSAYRSKIVEINFVLLNEGSASADDTDVYIDVEKGNYLIVPDKYLKQPPIEPKLPDQRRRDSLRYDLDRLGSSIIPLAERKTPNISGPTIQPAPAGATIHFHIQRIKQTSDLPLNGVYLVFPPVTDSQAFGMRYSLNSYSLPKNVRGRLHVKVELP
jgi:hypothetical protein